MFWQHRLDVLNHAIMKQNLIQTASTGAGERHLRNKTGDTDNTAVQSHIQSLNGDNNNKALKI